MGLPTSGWYSTGMGGSPGVGDSPENLAPLATVVVTTPGASSVPSQPTAQVDAGDASVPSQVAGLMMGGEDVLTGPGPNVSTGIGGGHVGFRP
jgi:hypothetical protein